MKPVDGREVGASEGVRCVQPRPPGRGSRWPCEVSLPRVCAARRGKRGKGGFARTPALPGVESGSSRARPRVLEKGSGWKRRTEGATALVWEQSCAGVEA